MAAQAAPAGPRCAARRKARLGPVSTAGSRHPDLEDRMQRVDRDYALAFGNHPHPMRVADRGTMAYLAVSKAAVQRCGHSREDFFSLTVPDLRPAHAVPALPEAGRGFASRAAAETHYALGTRTNRHKDGPASLSRTPSPLPPRGSLG